MNLWDLYSDDWQKQGEADYRSRQRFYYYLDSGDICFAVTTRILERLNDIVPIDEITAGKQNEEKCAQPRWVSAFEI